MKRPAMQSGGETASRSAAVRPPSCASGWVAFVGLAGFLLSLALMHGAALSPIHCSFAAMAATVLPMVVLDLFVLRIHRRSSTGLLWTVVPAAGATSVRALERVLVKLVGLAGSLALIGTCYWLFPIYHERFYTPYWAALREVAPWFVVAAPLYFFYIDRRMAEPHDGYWHAGMAVLGRFEGVDRALLWQYALGWVIKGFFLPLMFVYLTNIIGGVLSSEMLSGRSDFLAAYRLGWNLVYAVDVVFATAGYCFTLRLTDSHIRSSDPTLMGWVVALACYAPFSTLTFNRYLALQDELSWGGWLAEMPVLRMLLATSIVTLMGVYAWVTLVFGCRFSNLTHRGILTHGPFAWTKHPAYLSKNLAWWLISVPLMWNVSIDNAIRHCLLLLGVNVIYFLRARTEERHLSRDPVYVAYALWIEERGLLRVIGRALRFLRYVPPNQLQG